MFDKKNSICVILSVILTVVSFPVLLCINDYYFSCLFGTLFVLLTIIINCIYQKKIFSIKNVILLCFILFQFGLPILKAFNIKYDNFYINLFSEEILVSSIRYTVLCINSFSLGLMGVDFIKKVIIENKQNEDRKETPYFIKNERAVLIVAQILLAITALIAVPYEILRAVLSIKYGYTYIKNDVPGLQNGITNIAGDLIVPSLILLIIFSQNKKTKIKYVIFALLYSILILVNGSRTVPLAIIVALILMFINNRSFSKKGSFKRNLCIAFSMVLVMFLGTIIAQYRYYGEVKTLNPLLLVERAFEEMGFNFTSILFTKLFIPAQEGFRYGLSYLIDFICLIPKSLDPTGFISNLHSNSPEMWLANNLHAEYGGMFDFGVGYSVVAESFYNFGCFGFVFVLFQGAIIGLLINEEEGTGKFTQYINYIMCISLFTYPRRSFATLLKCIEYRILLIVFLIYFVDYVMRKLKRGNKKNESFND